MAAVWESHLLEMEARAVAEGNGGEFVRFWEQQTVPAVVERFPGHTARWMQWEAERVTWDHFWILYSVNPEPFPGIEPSPRLQRDPDIVTQGRSVFVEINMPRRAASPQRYFAEQRSPQYHQSARSRGEYRGRRGRRSASFTATRWPESASPSRFSEPTPESFVGRDRSPIQRQQALSPQRSTLSTRGRSGLSGRSRPPRRFHRGRRGRNIDTDEGQIVQTVGMTQSKG